MESPQQRRGQQAEELAWRHLRDHGLQPVTRNYRCRLGELDLIMRDGDQLVFVEVRYRRNTRYGGGAESITAHKQQRVIAAALHYLQAHPGEARHPARFDVVAVQPDGLDWIPNAFSAE